MKASLCHCDDHAILPLPQEGKQQAQERMRNKEGV
jgi:hypothetical protein